MGKKLTQKITSVVLSATTVVWLSGSAMIMPVAFAQTSSDLQAQIAALQAQLAALSSSSSSVSASCAFANDLTVGSKGDDVKCLQQYLNGAGHKVALSGAGSMGNETTFFGSLTKAAVAKWQAANGVSPAAGYFGPKSRAKYASMAAAPAPAPAPSPTPAPVAGVASGLTVSLSPSQPSASLFPESSASVPFTRLLFTASADGDVTVDSVKVQRTGSANNASFDGVILLDENGVRLGTSKTLSSDNTVTLTEDFTVKAGQTRTFTAAGDAAASLDSYAGQLASLSLVNVATKGGTTVNASYPLTGVENTVNGTLTIGVVTLTRGPLDPGTGATKEVGTKGYTFSSLKLTVGSAEKVRLNSIKWNQAGSAGSSDLSNVKVVVDGTSYDTTISSDGKFYTATFGGGIEIDKGLAKDVSIKADIDSGSNRTADFDLFRFTDIQAKGLTYGYDIVSTAATTSADNDNDGEFQDAEPRFDAFRATIGTGSIAVSASTKVPAQNVAINLSNQPLAGFDVTVKGEAVSVGGIVFRLGRWNGSSATGFTQDITNITLVDEKGTVVAGPVDIASGGPTVTFTDTVVFPVGTGTYTLRGKLTTDYANNDTVAASTTASSNFTSVKGTVTNVTLTPTPSSSITANTMTVKAAALRVSTSPVPVAQTIVAGLKGFTFANYTLDATASGEDVRITQMSPEINFGQAASADDLTNCSLYDGSTALNTGSNVINPLNADVTADNKVFNFDSGLTVLKGTVKNLALKCDTIATTTSTNSTTYNYTWEIEGVAADTIATGLTSGSAVTETYDDTSGQAITLAQAGSLAVALDSSSPAVKLANANTTDNVLTNLRFTATNEAINVNQLGMVLGGTGSNTPQDLVKVTIWDGATKVGEMVFTGDNATATLAGFVIPKDSDKVLTLKGDLAAIGSSEAGRPGHLVRVEYDGAAADSSGNATRGVGQSSGTTVYATGGITSSNGVRVFKAAPKLAKLALPDTKLTNSSGKILYRFSVTAPSTGGVGLFKFSFNISTSTSGTTSQISVASLEVRGYSDSAFSQSAYSNNGLLNSATQSVIGADAGVYEILFDPVAQDGTDEAIQVPAGTTRYFQLTGTITNTTSTSSVTVQLQGDAAYSQGNNNQNNDTADTFTGSGAGTYAFATTAANVNLKGGSGTEHNDFIWSGNSTTTSGVATYDWINGFAVDGLPSVNLSAETLTP